jgi:hypothetical protein
MSQIAAVLFLNFNHVSQISFNHVAVSSGEEDASMSAFKARKLRDAFVAADDVRPSSPVRLAAG